jgi:hypothetical protein
MSHFVPYLLGDGFAEFLREFPADQRWQYRTSPIKLTFQAHVDQTMEVIRESQGFERVAMRRNPT